MRVGGREGQRAFAELSQGSTHLGEPQPLSRFEPTLVYVVEVPWLSTRVNAETILSRGRRAQATGLYWQVLLARGCAPQIRIFPVAFSCALCSGRAIASAGPRRSR
jgi:hypothetical protein